MREIIVRGKDVKRPLRGRRSVRMTGDYLAIFVSVRNVFAFRGNICMYEDIEI